MSVQSKLNIFLNLIDYRNIYQLPYNNNAQTLATTIRDKRLTGKGLIKQNIKREAHRLQLYRTYRLQNYTTHRLQLLQTHRLRLYNRLFSKHIINLATTYVWRRRLTSTQRNRFINLANNANNIRFTNNLSTIDQIARLATPQITDNPLDDDFFNGAGNFCNNNNSLDSLILPAGCLGSSSSFP
ncbi:hypothetical protein RhiirA5_497431 [Rhizophagus irregularis]|uniref:Uncharacterized protein n=2 Tax=Rhizophagus irregularis TaxID=588596 RepID=A0A2I1E0Z6_9GLOM|nr:hypothetical protein RhiirA5_497431 [Rhizophagus irregularis]GBC23050.1 hypothetical protein GLOIN_2v1552491 [Rhizophagus irregularis DAOM 181602=DAOM 197198]PKC73477.1 hypothetical protein RhiirA1_530364 [Rhizophagus irregularis]PKK74278.1 hypothetical protein RhiirC2_774962 [Rhizophagus irregularis]PKY15800.1 hypothetical protein RhiirB3_520691 [Rhizophagus irregularis]